MSLNDQFKTAAENVKNLKQNPTDDEMLEIYALFKQAEVGDVNIPRPGMFDMKGKFKWDAWNNKKGVSKETAQQQYIDKVQELIAKYGMK